MYGGAPTPGSPISTRVRTHPQGSGASGRVAVSSGRVGLHPVVHRTAGGRFHGEPVPRSPYRRRRAVALLLAVALVGGLTWSLRSLLGGDGSDGGPGSAGSAAVTGGRAGAEAPAAGAAVAVAGREEGAPGPDLVGDEPTDVDVALADLDCTIGALQLADGSSGDGVACLQEALAAVGLYDGRSTAEYDAATALAVVAFQEQEDLYVDGVVGRQTAVALGIWPDPDSLVVHTPPPPDGATDLWGVELSPVASSGSSAPPLPPGSGSGYRVVYDRAGQRVWAVDGMERVVRSWLVSGSRYQNERPGTYSVYSRSELSTAWHGRAYLPLMIRYLKTDLGNIGFHGIPTSVADGSPYQTTEQLGTRLSGGCQRQHDLDAAFLWGFAPLGTKVVVT